MKGCGILNGEPILAEIFFRVSFLPQFIKLSKDSGSKHVFDVNPASPFWVEEKEEFTSGSHDILFLEALIHVLEMDEGGNQLGNVLTEVIFSQVAITSSVVKTDVDTCLEEIVLSDYRMEKGLHVDTTVLIPVELEESRGTEEVSKL